MAEFTREQNRRYARHFVLPEIGRAGQERLLAARVLVIGAGGLGSPSTFYLAAAGIGTIGLVDDDAVDPTNLQRQILHTQDRVGIPKVESARATVAALNPDVTLLGHPVRLDAANVDALIADYDIVADGSDNFPTRYLVNDACRRAGKTLVSAAVVRFEGQLATFKPGGPCYRCLHPESSDPEEGMTCVGAGVLGAVAGVLGTLQATEVVKEILGIGDSLAGHLLLVDGLATSFRKLRLSVDPACEHHG